MKKQIRNKSKLVLEKDIIRTLNTKTLAAAAGGVIESFSLSTCPLCHIPQ